MPRSPSSPVFFSRWNFPRSLQFRLSALGSLLAPATLSSALFFWGGSTVAGRGVMIGMPLRLAASIRVVVGLICMTLILFVYGKLHGAALWPTAAQTHAFKAIGLLILLASISGAIPLLIYFEGLRLTRASTAGYFEMMQTLAAVCVTWGFFHATLRAHQIVAGVVLMAAVAMVQRVQANVGN